MFIIQDQNYQEIVETLEQTESQLNESISAQKLDSDKIY